MHQTYIVVPMQWNQMFTSWLSLFICRMRKKKTSRGFTYFSFDTATLPMYNDNYSFFLSKNDLRIPSHRQDRIFGWFPNFSLYVLFFTPYLAVVHEMNARGYVDYEMRSSAELTCVKVWCTEWMYMCTCHAMPMWQYGSSACWQNCKKVEYVLTPFVA